MTRASASEDRSARRRLSTLASAIDVCDARSALVSGAAVAGTKIRCGMEQLHYQCFSVFFRGGHPWPFIRGSVRPAARALFACGEKIGDRLQLVRFQSI